MDIKELESFKLSDAVKFHDELNSKLWAGKDLHDDVYNALAIIAKDFITELGLSGLNVEDITISGSNAAYSYTPHSDLDLHILVDFSKLPNNEVYQELFNAKKNEYNKSHDITVNGVPVELYVQDSNQPHISLGEYSLLNKDWIKFPVKKKANFDQANTRAKYEKLGELIELAIRSESLEDIENVLDIIKRYRKAGLTTTGEFGPENLAYKALRSKGYIQKLFDKKQELHSKELSLEDYDPNGPPPGPEFPPTMPKGTIRVDVSDVYDWYKLGQHISNMKGLGKHDFGKGPPSTILSFGDEDLEHQYIDALKKTGLDTTDIDPKAHDTKKDQKVDPTYNVGEDSTTTKKFVYHVTPTKNLKSIAKQGLLPTVGERSSKIAGEKKGIYAFPDKVSAENAVMNWLGDEFDDEPLTMLKIDITGLDASKGADYELILDKVIEPSRIKKVKIDLGEASGYIPSKKEKNDPRFKTALTIDVKPDSIKKNAKAFGFKVSRAGVPPLLRK